MTERSVKSQMKHLTLKQQHILERAREIDNWFTIDSFNYNSKIYCHWKTAALLVDMGYFEISAMPVYKASNPSQIVRVIKTYRYKAQPFDITA